MKSGHFFFFFFFLLPFFFQASEIRSLSSDSSFQNYSTPFVVNIRMLDFVVKEEGKEEEEEEACNENSWGWGIDVDEIWFEKKRRSKVYCWIRFRNIVSSFKNIPIKYKWHKRCRNSWKYYKTACEEYFSEIAEFELRFDVVKKKETFLSWFIEPTKWKEIESREGIKQKIKSSEVLFRENFFLFLRIDVEFGTNTSSTT